MPEPIPAGPRPLVDATGRSSALVRLLRKNSPEASSTKAARPAFVGFKTHMTGVEVGAGRCARSHRPARILCRFADRVAPVLCLI